MGKPASGTSTRVRIIGVAIQNVIGVLLAVTLLEALMIVSFRFPTASPLPLPLIRYLHMKFDRNVTQVMPECAVY